MRLMLLVVFGAALTLLSGCSKSVLEERGPYLRAYHTGNLYEAETIETNAIRQELPQTQFELSKNSSWLLLDRAMTRFTAGDATGAIEDYSIALVAMDYYSKRVLGEQAAQLMLQDEVGAYQAPDYEQVLARVYFALALLQNGDQGNAYAILRQAEEYQQEKQNFYSKIPFAKQYHVQQNGLSKYLFALLSEKKGDLSNAKILYEQAAALIPCSSEVPFAPAPSPDLATILILCHNGNSPYKISTECPASQASAIALEILMASSGVRPSCSALPGIPVPALCRWPGSNPQPTFAKIGDCRLPLFPFFNIIRAAEFELEQDRPFIVARGVARLIIRRAAVSLLENQDPCLRMIVDCTMFIANATTRVDTRSWTTLPAFIDVARFDVEPGCQTLAIQVEGAGAEEKIIQLNLKKSELCIINVFNLHPGVRRFVVPFRYLAN